MLLFARLRPVVAALVVAAAGGLGALAGPFLATAPAAAATCSGVSGVSVVVEFNQLGGGVRQSCDAEGAGRTADRVLEDAGYTLDDVQRFPGFVCRIDGKPADDPCVNTPPADAYWGLWWSDGTSGKWVYSSLGAGSLTLPAGAYVAMVWDGSSGDVRPTLAPGPHVTPTPMPTPSATPTHSQAPTQSPTHAPTQAPTSSATATARPPSATPTAKPSRTHPPSSRPPTTSATPSSTPSASTDPPSEQPTAAGASSTPPSQGGGGLPGWVAPALVAALMAAAAVVAVVRRRSP